MQQQISQLHDASPQQIPSWVLPQVTRELCNRSFHKFLRTFWPTICHDPFQGNWHIGYLCDELQQVAERVARRKPSPHDLIVNVPPGTTKTTICSVMFPVWCWTLWPWMRFLTFSYSAPISLKPADMSRKVIQSQQFGQVYPDIRLRKGKEGVTDYEAEFWADGSWHYGGYRFSSSVGGTGTGLHGDINIVDDPLNPQQAASDTELRTTNDWHEQTLPTRKTDKRVTPTILIMQRLHENDPSGFLLAKKKLRIRHICLPADISDPGYARLVNPQDLRGQYVDGLLDPLRLSREVIEDLEERLGQYGAAAQLGQNPAPPAGGMFKVDRLAIIDSPPPEVSVVKTVRYWDKAGTDPTKERGSREPAYTVGVKMSLLANGKYLVQDVVRGRWSAEDREGTILATAQADGQGVEAWTEQEPGSGGKESAEFTVRNLAGFSVHAERPVGNKVARADTWSVQVNRYNVILLRADWNAEYKGEHGFFPNSRFKDQVDASSGAFGKLTAARQAWVLSRR